MPKFFEGTVGTTLTAKDFGYEAKGIVVVNDNDETLGETGVLFLYETTSDTSLFAKLLPGEFISIQKPFRVLYIKSDSTAKYRIMSL